MTYGVILARFQPVHNGHLALIKKAVKENDKVVLLVGSADKFNIRNPIPTDLRISLLMSSLEKLDILSKCIIVRLDDLTSESDNSIDWGFYVYAKIISIIKEPYFTMYYSDGYEIITTWFPGFILKNYVSLALLARGNVEKGVSATKVRDLIKSKNDVELIKCVPDAVYEHRNILKTFIELSEK